MTERNFYYMLRAGDEALGQQYAQARARSRPVTMPMKSHESISITDNFCMPFTRPAHRHRAIC